MEPPNPDTDVAAEPRTALPQERAEAKSARGGSAFVTHVLELSQRVARLLLAPMTRIVPAEVEQPDTAPGAQPLANWTSGPRRIDLDFGVGYDQDPKRVVEVLEAAARSLPDVLGFPAPAAVFLGCRQSTLDFRLSTWTSPVPEFAPTRRQIALAIHVALRGAGIESACPQRSLRSPKI